MPYSARIPFVPFQYTLRNVIDHSLLVKQSIWLFIWFAFAVNSYAQPDDPSANKYSISRSTLGLGGTTNLLSTTGKSFTVCHSIGQASAIGTFHNNGFSLLQGYQQPLFSRKQFKIYNADLLKVNIYPNPFHESILISFEEPIHHDIELTLSDLTGKVFYHQRFPATQLIDLIGLEIPAGAYVIHIQTQERQCSITQIKH